MPGEAALRETRHPSQQSGGTPGQVTPPSATGTLPPREGSGFPAKILICINCPAERHSAAPSGRAVGQEAEKPA
ncbi:predicted protein [Streptomyces sp. SPB78]|nr:predicted protein [Streptomyces sp. SPB78]